METPKVIDLFSGEYSFLSNFYIYKPITYHNLVACNVESLYQASKSSNEKDRKLIISLMPAQAKRQGKLIELRSDWEEVKDQIMYELLTLKFQNSFLRDCLLATEDAELIEGNYWNDTYWGVCGGVGENKLGKLLTQVREEIKKK